MDAAAHRAKLHPERRGDLLVGQALDVTQDDRGPVFGRERLKRGRYVGVQVALLERLGGRRAPAVEALRRVFAEALEPYPLPAASHVEEQVSGDPVQPALERARRVLRQGPENAD